MSEERLYVSQPFTAIGGFTSGIEGPACDRDGNLYAVNYERTHTIGKVTPAGECSVYIELPEGSTGNGIRFNRAGDMFIADYTGHNVLKVKSGTREAIVHAHEPLMSQPNDIAIADDGTIFASDPDWAGGTGRIWRISTEGVVDLVQDGMGTTNGIEVSPDGKWLYVNETLQRSVWAFELLPGNSLGQKRLMIEFPDYGLDGMRCDSEGNLYVTRHGKGTIVKLSPAGVQLEEIALQGTDCTNLTFGGPDGRTCYVTVADRGNIETFRVEHPGRCWTTLQ